MDVNYFTIYWRHGQRQVVQGETVDQAFNSAGIGDGAIAAIDWYDNGVTDTHVFVGNNQWVKKKPLKISFNDFNKELSPENIKDLCGKLKAFAYIEVKFENQDSLTIQDRYSQFAHEWLHLIAVNFQQYVPPKDNEEEYWMSIGTEYFDPQSPEQAIQAFLERLNKKPFETSGHQTADLKTLLLSQVL